MFEHAVVAGVIKINPVASVKVGGKRNSDYAEDATKTRAGHRKLKIFATAEKCLRSIKHKQKENQAFFGDTYQNKDGYVFVREDGKNYDPDYISDMFIKAMKEFGRPEITLHKLRHTCASLLIEKGWDVKCKCQGLFSLVGVAKSSYRAHP